MDTAPLTTSSIINRLSEEFRENDTLASLVTSLTGDVSPKITVTGLSGSAEAFMARALVEKIGKPVIVVTQRSDEAGDLYEDLAALNSNLEVHHYPSRQILPYDFKPPVGEIIGRRMSALSAILTGTARIVVCPIRALLEPTIPREMLRQSQLVLEKGKETPLEDLVQHLVKLGFRRVPLVEEVGDFALRGGLIDFFSPGFETPLRVEYFGDEVDSIRKFDVTSQRTLGQLNKVTMLPRREIPITQETIEGYLEYLPEEDADFIRSRYVNDPELPGLEWLALMFGIEQGNLLEYLSHDFVVLMHGENALKDEIERLYEEADSIRERLTDRISKLPEPDEYYLTENTVFETLQNYPRLDLVPFKGGVENIISFECQPHPSLGSRLDLLGKTLEEFHQKGTVYFIATDSSGQKERLTELVEEKAAIDFTPPVEVINLKGGFVCKSGNFAVLTDHEIFSRYHRRIRKKKFHEGVAISDYAHLQQGDYVVHNDYGVARYLGLKTLEIDGRSRDCLELVYADKDKLFVPIEEFNRVAKYSGKDGVPQLSYLGGRQWDKIKKKTKEAIGDMARDLLKLYAARRDKKGFEFSEDTVWLKQLEASFIYEETPDQDKAITDVKLDMMREKPMDRLICGDVGYGKTEVAVRAAFKAIDSGKQVAILVPTTVLAQQHYTTFKERLADFPVRVEVLSRFKTRKQQLEIVEDLAKGQVDLVIGTHRLLSKDVKFHDLGLLVIDEEHRFGVRHKEKLRHLKETVDTIAMTATPIPRTLQMSLMSVRDMSLITTSPKDRLPIITQICDFDDAIIATAILREIDRGGQVFFVHNRVQTIEAMHSYLQKLLPQVKFAVAHGQMHERSLEGIMLAFLAKEFDVLLCTSIIESGLDITSANTIIINRADKFGLAQLYQIRGRVGRSSRRAYAYLLTPPIKNLTADAVKRLRALEAHSDLGAGFALAMRDLEIRGAGTILGAKQSGYIEEVGYDLYNKLLEETVAELKGEEIIRLPDTKLEMSIEIYLPDNFVNDNQHKVDIYRRIADSYNLDQVEKIRDEVIDRFGKLPPSANNLFEAAAVKISAAMLGIEKVTIRSGRVNMFFAEDRKLTRQEIEAFRQATDQPLEFSIFGKNQVMLDIGQIAEDQRLNYLRNVLGKVG